MRQVCFAWNFTGVAARQILIDRNILRVFVKVYVLTCLKRSRSIFVTVLTISTVVSGVSMIPTSTAHLSCAIESFVQILLNLQSCFESENQMRIIAPVMVLVLMVVALTSSASAQKSSLVSPVYIPGTDLEVSKSVTTLNQSISGKKSIRTVSHDSQSGTKKVLSTPASFTKNISQPSSTSHSPVKIGNATNSNFGLTSGCGCNGGSTSGCDCGSGGCGVGTG